MQILKWSRLVGSGEAFHAARNVVTREVPLHGHDFAEVLWVDAGRGVHRVNGGTSEIAEGDLVMIRPTDFHSIASAPGELLELTNVAFASATLDFLGERYFREEAWMAWRDGGPPFSRRVESSALRACNGWVDELAAGPRDRFSIERFLLSLVGALRPCEAVDLPPGTPDWLVGACREIEKIENFSDGAAGFTRVAGRGREHVARSVREHLKTTPSDFVNAIRMRHAARQLTMSRLSVVEIALECGIENLSHFYRLFRKQHGTTPREYRLARHRPIT